ncbi:hypothetical protein ACQ4PT_017401 [Festuca glaucescens]
MARRRPQTWAAAVLAAVLVVVVVTTAAAAVGKRLLVDMTLVPDAASTGAGKSSSPLILSSSLAGPHCPAQLLCLSLTCVRNGAPQFAVCLDGSPPAYHLHRGSGAGAHGWLLQFEGGGWCNSARSCAERAGTRRGSTSLMNKLEVFSGVLSNDSAMNPDFYNWNRVKLRYCDGGSFAGDSEFTNGSSVIHMRGQRIWDAIITDLCQKGLDKAKKGAEKNLNKDCLNSTLDPYQCYFPQYTLPNIKTPYFILNSAYDVYQVHTCYNQGH